MFDVKRIIIDKFIANLKENWMMEKKIVPVSEDETIYYLDSSLLEYKRLFLFFIYHYFWYYHHLILVLIQLKITGGYYNNKNFISNFILNYGYDDNFFSFWFHLFEPIIIGLSLSSIIFFKIIAIGFFFNLIPIK